MDFTTETDESDTRVSETTMKKIGGVDMEYDISDEIENDNVREERRQQALEEKTARLIAKIERDRFLKNDVDAIKENIERFGVTEGLGMYAASVASDVQEAIDCGYPDKEIQRQWLNVVKGCIFHLEDFHEEEKRNAARQVKGEGNITLVPAKITTVKDARRILKVQDCFTDEQLEIIIKQFGEITQENLDLLKPLARSLEKENNEVN